MISTWLIFLLSFVNVLQGDASKDASPLYHLTRPSNQTKGAPILILLHGYCSNETDLFSFASSIPAEWTVISARAPMQVSKDQYKWYSVDFGKDSIRSNFQEAEVSRKKILALIDFAVKKYHSDSSRVVVAGFSQGAILSMNCALTRPERISAFGVMSGRLMEEIKPMVVGSPKFSSMKAFVSHGTLDPLMNMNYFNQTVSFLKSKSIQVTTSVDEVQHTISSKQFEQFIGWIQGN